MVSRRDRNELQKLSKAAFNREHRLAVVKAATEMGPLFDKNEISERSGVASTTVYEELNALAELALLDQLRDGSRNLFSIRDGPFWAWCDSLLRSVESTNSTGEASPRL